MALQLSPEQEQVVGQAIHAGLIRIPDDVIGVGVEIIRSVWRHGNPPVHRSARKSGAANCTLGFTEILPTRLRCRTKR